MLWCFGVLCVVSCLLFVVCRMGCTSCRLMLIGDGTVYALLVFSDCFVFYCRVFHVVVDCVVCCVLLFVR